MNTNLVRHSALVGVGIALSLGLVCLHGNRALADPIPAGFDYLHTPDGGAVINPSDYGIGPDIDIPLRSRPLYGDVDTVIQRSTGLTSPPANPLGTMDAEIIALSLESINPVPLGTSFFDVFVDLDPENRSAGTVTVTTHTPGPAGGGTFDSFFDVFARVTLTEVGNPMNEMVFTVQDTISSTGSPWTHSPPPAYPGGGGFIPGPTQHTGPHPETVPGTGPPLSEDPIRRGFDFFVTPPDGNTFVDLGPMGIVALEGVPLPNIVPGPVDTVVARKAMGPLEGGVGTVPIELVALHLRSIAPVDMSPVGGPPAADLHITVDAENPDLFNLPVPIPVPPSSGQMEIMNAPGGAGGQFRACFGDEPGCDASVFGAGLGVPQGGVHSDAIFVIPGGDPSNPADVIQVMQAPSIVLSSFGQFDHGGPNRAGNFDITFVSHDGPHPAHVDRISEFVVPEELPGDFNHDEHVDAADYVWWRKFDGSLVGYQTWRANFGASLVSGSGGQGTGQVPEPVSVTLVAAGLLVVWSRRRGRWHKDLHRYVGPSPICADARFLRAERLPLRGPARGLLCGGR